MTSLLRTTAYPYALKKPAGPFYYLRVRSLGCLDVDGIIARIDRLPFVISPWEYAYLVNIFLDECIAATAEGFHIATPQMRWAPAARGTIGPSDLWRTFASGRFPVTFHLTPDPVARQAAAIGVQVCGAAMPKAGKGKGDGSKGSSAEGSVSAGNAPMPSAPESSAPTGGP